MKINSDYLMSDKGLDLLNKLFYSSGEGILFFEKDGKVAALNPRAVEIFGYTEEEIIGKSVEILIPQSQRVRHIKYREKYVSQPSPRQMGAGRDLEGLKKGGDTFPLEISLSYITHENQTLVVAFVTDITIRKRNEKELEEQRLKLKEYTERLERKVRERTSELEHMNLGLQSQIQERKLAESALKESLEDLKRAEQEILNSLKRERQLGEMKSRFVSMASHEFRTPLTTILSSANLILRYTDNEEAKEKHVNRIKGSVQNLTNILNDFLSLEKLESGAQKVILAEVKLKALIDEVVDELQGMMQEKQNIQVECDDILLVSDAHILKNILLNIVSNAIKYSMPNGTIEIRLYEERKVYIVVKDYGIGIPLKDQDQLFERFHRAENVTNINGTGLGLSIVKKYIELLQGDITFESEVGKGSTFTIELPK
ncbi:MAG: PAS domain-containing sensor histidine kinase [Bacteroidota bacterium]